MTRAFAETLVKSRVIMSGFSFGDTVEKTGDDFLEKLVSCCLRLDVRAQRVACTFECLFADPPLFGQDARVEPNGRWPSHRAVVSDVSLPNQSSAAEFVSTLVDRVLMYSKLYSPVKRFAVAFNRGLNKNVKVLALRYICVLAGQWTSSDLRIHVSQARIGVRTGDVAVADGELAPSGPTVSSLLRHDEQRS
jgi:hypothetical protein